MRNHLVVLSCILLACGCDSGRVKPIVTVPRIEIGGASKTELTLLELPPKSKFRPNEPVVIQGNYTVARGHQVSFAPKVMVMPRSVDVSVSQVRATLKEHPPGAIPFEAEILCPKAPGKYAVLATINVAREGTEEQSSMKSNRIEFEVIKP